MLAARANTLRKLRENEGVSDDHKLLSKLVAYTSTEAHSCVEKAAMISFIKLRKLETDENYTLRGETLRQVT